MQSAAPEKNEESVRLADVLQLRIDETHRRISSLEGRVVTSLEGADARAVARIASLEEELGRRMDRLEESVDARLSVNSTAQESFLHELDKQVAKVVGSATKSGKAIGALKAIGVLASAVAGAAGWEHIDPILESLGL